MSKIGTQAVLIRQIKLWKFNFHNFLLRAIRQLVRSDLIRLAHKALVFVSIAALVFSPLGNLVNYYTREYFPRPLAEQIARVIPEVQTASAHTDDVFVFIKTASTSPWTVPDDWNSASNSIEVIGGGGGGGDSGGSGPGGAGGGGYSRINNLALTAGATVTFGVGASGSGGATGGNGVDGGHTWFNASSFAACTDNTVCVKAEGGAKSSGGASVTGGLGGNFGSTASAVGTTRYAGGNGGLGCTGDGSGGGGGAAGPNGDGTGNVGGKGTGDAAPGLGGGGGGGGGGSDGLAGTEAGVAATCGTTAATNTVGGAGGNNYLGTGGGAGGNLTGGAGSAGGGGGGGDDGGAGGNGGAGNDWVTDWGSGGGGGGGGDASAGANGALYGGGGGGGEACTAAACAGEDGIIVVKYQPRAVQSRFRWYNEGGTLDSPTSPISAEDIKASGSEALTISTTYRLRLQIANIDNYGSNANFTSDKFRLEMARAGTSCTSLSSGWDWKTVPLAATLASHAFDIEATADFVDGASTSASILTAPAGAATFTNGYGMDTRATTGFQTINENQYTEIEWALKPSTDANTSADYCFRAGWITDASTTPDTRASMSFTKIASASVQAAAAAPTPDVGNIGPGTGPSVGGTSGGGIQQSGGGQSGGTPASDPSGGGTPQSGGGQGGGGGGSPVMFDWMNWIVLRITSYVLR